MLNIVLHEPEIAMNTGNIGRTCAVTGSKLHLIHPFGFFIDDKKLARAGMDYWHTLDISYYDNFADFVQRNNNPKIYIVETTAQKLYTEVAFERNAFLMFGRESGGVPAEILQNYTNTTIKVPMLEGSRSLNLSSCVSVVIYEALRQHSFANLS